MNAPKSLIEYEWYTVDCGSCHGTGICRSCQGLGATYRRKVRDNGSEKV